MRRLPYVSIENSALRPRLPIAGYIKVGGKRPQMKWSKSGPYSLPTSSVEPVRFEVTTFEKDEVEVTHPQDKEQRKWIWDRGYKRDIELHKKIGDNPTRLNVRLMFPNPFPSLKTYFGAHNGQKAVCYGNGVEAQDDSRGGTVPCTCPRLAQFEGPYDGPPPKDGLVCKPHLELAVVLDDAERYGLFWIFKSTSWRTIANIRTQIAMFHQQFGRLDGLPLVLEVQKTPIRYDDGKRTTQPIVNISMDGSFDTARMIASGKVEEARRLSSGIVAPFSESEFEQAMSAERELSESEVGDEFHPEAPLANGKDGRTMEERLRDRAAPRPAAPTTVKAQDAPASAPTEPDFEVVDEDEPETVGVEQMPAASAAPAPAAVPATAAATAWTPPDAASACRTGLEDAHRLYLDALRQVVPHWTNQQLVAWQTEKVKKASTRLWAALDFELASLFLRRGETQTDGARGQAAAAPGDRSNF